MIAADVLDENGTAYVARLGSAAQFEHLDVTSEAAWERVVSATLARRGGIDILVNCAGIAIFEALVDFDGDDFDRVISVNLIGAFLGMKHVGRTMMNAGRGSIINISSTEGLQASNSMAAYASSKWGLRGLTKVAAMEFGRAGVRVNSVHPGPVNTMMLNPKNRPAADLNNISMCRRMPLARVADPAEIANVCAFLAGDAASFMTGAELAVDGGATIGMYHQGRPGSPAVQA